MDSSQDLESLPGDVVTWVPSQTPNAALRELLKEAENERRTRPSTPVHGPMSWTYSLAPTFGRDSSHLPLSGSASSAPLALRASESSFSRRAHPASAPQRLPLATSTSSTNRPPRHSTRPRSSSHSTGSLNGMYAPKDDEPEALSFIELLKDASRQVDRNSEKKEQAAREKETGGGKGKGKERDHPLGMSRVDNRTGLHTNNSTAQPLTKTSSAFTISAKAPQKTSSASVSAGKPETSGRPLAKTASLGAPGVHLVSGKSTQTSLPSPNLNCDLKLAPVLRPSVGSSNSSSLNHPIARKASFPKTVSNDEDSEMQGVIDLIDTDTEWERPISRADTTMFMQVDNEESDTEMDVSFFNPGPPPQSRLPASKPKPQHPHPMLSSGSTQRTSTGPPPLGMRRAPQLHPPQYSSTQSSKGVTVPRFKPPLLANVSRTTHGSGSGSRSVTTATSSRSSSTRGGNSKAPATETASRTSQDPDSSFDISFDVDADALEEAMKAYD